MHSSKHKYHAAVPRRTTRTPLPQSPTPLQIKMKITASLSLSHYQLPQYNITPSTPHISSIIMLRRGICAQTNLICKRHCTSITAATSASSSPATCCLRNTPPTKDLQCRGISFIPNNTNASTAKSMTSLASLYTNDTTNINLTVSKHLNVHVRTFQNVGHYHNVADETLHSIQDAVEEYFEDYYFYGLAERGGDLDIPEVNYASGVLTINLPGHGTWVLNKQTPNEQIWWSSPISGPKRYEYDEKRGRWVYSRVVDESASEDVSDVSYSEEDTLGGILNKEFGELFGEEGLDLEA